MQQTGGKGYLTWKITYSVALESSQGNGITFNAAGSSLTAAFPNATMNEWHHIGNTPRKEIIWPEFTWMEICRTKKVIPGLHSAHQSKSWSKNPCGRWLEWLPGRIGSWVVRRSGHSKINERNRFFWRRSPFIIGNWWAVGREIYDIRSGIINVFCGVISVPSDLLWALPWEKTNEEGYYRIEGVSYGTGQTFIAKPSKDFYSRGLWNLTYKISRMPLCLHSLK